jgi:hypothetical protein
MERKSGSERQAAGIVTIIAAEFGLLSDKQNEAKKLDVISLISM